MAPDSGRDTRRRASADEQTVDDSRRPTRTKDVADGATKQMLAEASLSKPESLDWFKQSAAARKKDFEVNADGKYDVRNADSLWTIAERRLKKDSEDSAPHSVHNEVKRIRKLNQGEHPSLKKNGNYLRDDWELKIYDDKTQPKVAGKDKAEIVKTAPSTEQIDNETGLPKKIEPTGSRSIGRPTRDPAEDAGKDPKAAVDTLGAKGAAGAIGKDAVVKVDPDAAAKAGIDVPGKVVTPGGKVVAEADKVVAPITDGKGVAAGAKVVAPDDVKVVAPGNEAAKVIAPDDVKVVAPGNEAAKVIAPDDVKVVAPGNDAAKVIAPPADGKLVTGADNVVAPIQDPKAIGDGIKTPAPLFPAAPTDSSLDWLNNRDKSLGQLPVPYSFQNVETDPSKIPGYKAPSFLGVPPYFDSSDIMKRLADPTYKPAPKPPRGDNEHDDEPLPKAKETFLPPPLNMLEKLFQKQEPDASTHSPEFRGVPVTDKSILKTVPDATYIGEKGSIRTMIDKKPTIVPDQQFWLAKSAASSFARFQDDASKMGKDLRLVDMNSGGRMWEQQEAIRKAHSATVFAKHHSRHEDGLAMDISRDNFNDPAVLKLAREHGWLQGNANGSKIRNDPAHLSYVPELDKHNPDNIGKVARDGGKHANHDGGETHPGWHRGSRHRASEPAPPRHRRRHSRN